MPVPTSAPQAARSTSPSRIEGSRLLVLLLVVAVATGLAATVASAGTMPSCRITDTLTAQRSYTHWSRTVLDTRFRLSSTYAPTDLRTTSNAGLNGGHRVRALVMADLKAMATAARAAGARLVVQSGYRSYTTQKSTFAYWVRVHGYARRSRRAPVRGTASTSSGRLDRLPRLRRLAPVGLDGLGQDQGGQVAPVNAWKYGFVMTYPKGKTTVTCYVYEPWHYRYVGKEWPRRVRASGLTLREYLWRQQDRLRHRHRARRRASRPPSESRRRRSRRRPAPTGSPRTGPARHAQRIVTIPEPVRAPRSRSSVDSTTAGSQAYVPGRDDPGYVAQVDDVVRCVSFSAQNERRCPVCANGGWNRPDRRGLHAVAVDQAFELPTAIRPDGTISVTGGRRSARSRRDRTSG